MISPSTIASGASSAIPKWTSRDSPSPLLDLDHLDRARADVEPDGGLRSAQHWNLPHDACRRPPARPRACVAADPRCRISGDSRRRFTATSSLTFRKHEESMRIRSHQRGPVDSRYAVAQWAGKKPAYQAQMRGPQRSANGGGRSEETTEGKRGDAVPPPGENQGDPQTETRGTRPEARSARPPGARETPPAWRPASRPPSPSRRARAPGGRANRRGRARPPPPSARPAPEPARASSGQRARPSSGAPETDLVGDDAVLQIDEEHRQQGEEEPEGGERLDERGVGNAVEAAGSA